MYVRNILRRMITGQDKLEREETEYEKHNRNLRHKICHKVVKLGLIFEGRGKGVYYECL